MKSSLFFLLGFGMGTFLGLLIAPDNGRNTRKKIRDEADKLIDKAISNSRFRTWTDKEFVGDGNLTSVS